MNGGGLSEDGMTTSGMGIVDDGWMNGKITGAGPTGGSDVARTDGGGGAMDPPPAPEGLGLGINTFGLALNFLF